MSFNKYFMRNKEGYVSMRTFSDVNPSKGLIGGQDTLLVTDDVLAEEISEALDIIQETEGSLTKAIKNCWELSRGAIVRLNDLTKERFEVVVSAIRGLHENVLTILKNQEEQIDAIAALQARVETLESSPISSPPNPKDTGALFGGFLSSIISKEESR